MLVIIVILIAAILVTLLGAWNAIPGILASIIGFILWMLLAGTAGAVLGDWGFGIVLALPFILIFGFGIAETARGNLDMWGNPKK